MYAIESLTMAEIDPLFTADNNECVAFITSGLFTLSTKIDGLLVGCSLGIVVG